jgi:hypothetical protein
MIYDVYFAYLHKQGQSWDGELALWNDFDPKVFISDYIKSGKSNDSFVFITTTAQEPQMVKFIEDYGLKDFMSYEMPYFVTNGNHASDGRKLRLRVFQSIKKEAA